jgi:DNA-binding transcriptional LysR family regulator
MIAVPVSGDIRLVVVAAPAYFARHPKPKHPRDLAEHECIACHPAPSAPLYRWEFVENGRNFSVAVPARVLCTDPTINIRLALAGMGVTMVREDRIRDVIAKGELVTVLEEFSGPFPGYYLYYPQRRQASPALRAFVDYLRRSRNGGQAKRGRTSRSRAGR